MPTRAQMKLQKLRFLVESEIDVARVIVQAKRMSAALGFEAVGQSSIATAASELAHNILKYAGKGHLTIQDTVVGSRSGIEILAEDRGPGIADIEQAMQDRFSSGGTLGLGLPGVRRLMDEFKIESAPGQGTRVMARKFR